jgi:hypothetical protein
MVMDYSILNLVMDFVLVAASIWMVLEARGIGGIVGTSMTRIVIGAIILGVAHLIATFLPSVLVRIDPTFIIEPAVNNFIHRVIVLAGFVLLVAGFRKIAEIKR